VILVAGGTGRLGRRVVTRLTTRGEQVRVLSRDALHASSLAASGAELFEGDVRDPTSVARAVAGAKVVISAVQGFAGRGVTPASVDRDGNQHLIDAAARARADVILMSVVGASPQSPMELFRAKYDAEQHLAASALRWTVVRATAFIELWAELMAKRVVFGRGDNPINFVSVDDVAAVVERVTIDNSYRGRVVEVGGPQNLTGNELAALLNDVRGRHDHVRHVPRAMLRLMAPFARLPRAALTMDTADMTFDATRTIADFADLALTEPSVALAAAQPTP
jgi:uncharacterized protein YbjT (DUF2867 family)